ncbi:flippase-like domain-containing protein [Tolypothrix campylonemoides VB511288]|nr:flippase-like domain-containing protein [Tolypothrix campylonemoides VB511288]
MTTIKSRLKRNWLYLFLGTVFTVVLLSWALKDVSWIAVWGALQSAQIEWLFLGWVAYLSSYWVRALRWGHLLAVHCQPGRFKIRLAAIFIGFGANSILPAQLGEFIRLAVLHKSDKVPFAAALGSIFVERLLDIGVVFLLLLIPLGIGALPKHSGLNSFALGWFAVALVMVWFILLIAASFPEPMARFVGNMSKKIGLGRFKLSLEASVVKFLGALSALRSPQVSLIALIETICIWGLNAVTYWTGLMAFKMSVPGFLGALFIQSSTALAIALPSTPGYIGSFEAGIRFALSIYSTPIHIIIAYAIAMRFLMCVTIPIIGFAIAARLSLSLSDLTSKAN